MSGFAREWAWRQKGLTPTEKCVLIGLCDFHTEKNGCFPTLKTIADLVNVGSDTVVRALSSLEDKGLIKKINRFRENGGRKSNFYEINFTTIDVPSSFNKNEDQLLENPITHYRKIQQEPKNLEHSDTTYRAEPIIETSNQEPPDADSVFWAEATALAVAAGIPKKTCGALIGKALKLSGGDRPLILEKLESAAEKGADDPVSWLMSGLGGRKKSARNDKMAKINEAFAKLEEENARIKAEWAANGVFDDPIGVGEGDIQVLQPDASVGSVGIHDEGRKGVRKILARRPQKVIRPIGGGIVKSAIRADDSGTGWGSGKDFKKGEQEFCLNKFEQSSGMKQRMTTSTRSSNSRTANEFEF